jgi:hypothetical protein
LIQDPRLGVAADHAEILRAQALPLAGGEADLLDLDVEVAEAGPAVADSPERSA